MNFTFFFSEMFLHFFTIISSRTSWKRTSELLRSTIVSSRRIPPHHLIVWSENDKSSKSAVNIKALKMRVTKTGQGIMSNQCNQYEYASPNVGTLNRHVKSHRGEKSNKCNQCDYASSVAGNLRRHLKSHSGEKSYKSGMDAPPRGKTGCPAPPRKIDEIRGAQRGKTDCRFHSYPFPLCPRLMMP